MLNPMQLAQLKNAADAGVACEIATKVPAELTVAQWALESGWGSHQPGNNCFGIKQYDGCSGTQSLETIEFVNGVKESLPQLFATFPSLDLCFQRHAILISSSSCYATPWKAYLGSPNPTLLIKGIAPIYATDPDYGDKLLAIIAMNEVKSAIAASRSSLNTQPGQAVGA